MVRFPPPVSSVHHGLALLGLPFLTLVASCQSADDDPPSAAATQQTQSPSSPAAAPATAAPSPGGSDGAASRASTQTAITPAIASAPDAGTAAAARPAAAPARSFAACIGVGATYDDCEVIYVTVTEAERCIQLAIDNCAEYGRMALDADLPVMWRLASASVSERAAPCELGVFYPDSIIIGGASGEITWDQNAPQPAALQIDVTLEARSVSGIDASYEVSTSAPLNPQRCAD